MNKLNYIVERLVDHILETQKAFGFIVMAVSNNVRPSILLDLSVELLLAKGVRRLDIKRAEGHVTIKRLTGDCRIIVQKIQRQDQIRGYEPSALALDRKLPLDLSQAAKCQFGRHPSCEQSVRYF